MRAFSPKLNTHAFYFNYVTIIIIILIMPFSKIRNKKHKHKYFLAVSQININAFSNFCISICTSIIRHKLLHLLLLSNKYNLFIFLLKLGVYSYKIIRRSIKLEGGRLSDEAFLFHKFYYNNCNFEFFFYYLL